MESASIDESSEQMAASPVKPQQSWKYLVVIFSIVQFIEAFGFGHIMAFLPLYLHSMGLPEAIIPQWTSILFVITSLLGLPLVPFWGVWADHYGRRFIIARSAYVEAVVFLLVGLSQNQWQLAGSLLLVGFQLGNTGIMLSTIRDAAPAHRAGLAISIMSAASAVGITVGPASAGLLVDHHMLTLHGIFYMDAVLSLASGLLLIFGFKEEHIVKRVAFGQTVSLAWQAVIKVFTVVLTLQLFAVFLCISLSRQMITPLLPIIVQQSLAGSTDVASAVGIVIGVAPLAGVLISPLLGSIGDRVGYTRVLIITVLFLAAGTAGLPFTHNLAGLTALSALIGLGASGATAMIYSALATALPPDRRTATLNLILVPAYLGNILGPALAAALVGFGFNVVLFAAVGVALASIFIRPALPTASKM